MGCRQTTGAAPVTFLKHSGVDEGPFGDIDRQFSGVTALVAHFYRLS